MNQFKIIQMTCPKCSGSNFWETSDNRLKCKNCRHLFKSEINLFNLSDQILNEVTSEFLLEHSTNIILERINISKYKLLKILTVLRMLTTKDLPEIFKNIVKPNDTYLECAIRPTKKEFLLHSSKTPQDSKLSHGESNKDLKEEKVEFKFKPVKQPIIGILCLEGKIFAKILSNIKADDLKFLLKKRVDKKETQIPGNWVKYFGLIFKGRLYRLAPMNDKKENRISALEGFWGYLKRKLTAKGGIRKEKLPLYLGEYVWKYNHRKISLKEQQKILLNLLFKSFNP